MDAVLAALEDRAASGAMAQAAVATARRYDRVQGVAGYDRVIAA